MRATLFHRVISLLLACNYFAFQAELFEEEFKENHPDLPSQLSFSKPTLTWESFDKENAPEAFSFDADIFFLAVIGWLPFPAIQTLPPHLPFRIIRDKSPPR